MKKVDTYVTDFPVNCFAKRAGERYCAHAVVQYKILRAFLYE
ncbi:hypothetical protein [Paenibacillus sp. FSL R7-0026]